jgi:predicted nuclease of restriction endonuclease-like RecB superfamily
LKQIQEKVAFLSQQKKLKEEKPQLELIKSIVENRSSTPVSKIINLIIQFAIENGQEIYSAEKITESQIIGLLHAYMTADTSQVKTRREPVFKIANGIVMPDFLVEIENEKFILEISRKRQGDGFDAALKQQVMFYMRAAKIKKGIIYYADFKEPIPSPKIETETIISNEKTYEMTIITT